MKQDKRNVKAKLLRVLNSVKILKNEYKTIQNLQKKFTWTSVSSISRQDCYSKDSNKQNTPQNIPLKKHTQIVNERKEQKLQQSPPPSMASMKSLRNTIFASLKELKTLEQHEKSIQRNNRKIKQFYRLNTQSSKISTSSQKDFEQRNNSNTNSVISSKLEVSIPLCLSTKPKKLFCPEGHEYYEGIINKEGLPHGSGRLTPCCSSIPFSIGNNKLKDVEFYQGKFRNGKFDGFGTLSYHGGIKYVGEFNRGYREGKGSLYHRGKVETAKWVKDSFVSVL